MFSLYSYKLIFRFCLLHFLYRKRYIYKNNLHNLFTVSTFCHASWTQFLIQIKTFPCLSLSVFHCLGILAFLSFHNILECTVICCLYIDDMGHVPPHSAAVPQCWNRIPSKLPWDNSRYWKKMRALSAFAYLEQLQTKHYHQQVTVVCERQEVKKICS